MAEQQMVVFPLGQEEYGVSIHQVKEIIHYHGATEIPNMPSYMEGMITLRHQVLPVISLAARFFLAPTQSQGKRVMICENRKREVGIVVDEVTEVIWLADSAIEEMRNVISGCEYVEAIGKYEDRLLIILDIEKLLNIRGIEDEQIEDYGCEELCVC